jgi:hypothetical protein
MVLRTPHGAGIRAPEHHSEATEAMLAHIPGLRVVTNRSVKNLKPVITNERPRPASSIAWKFHIATSRTGKPLW